MLAAGLSARMEGRHKLLLPVGDEPAVRHASILDILARGQNDRCG
ncbi:hypothetical protein AB4Y44_12960 [Paraburkholderia sp. BR10937]